MNAPALRAALLGTGALMLAACGADREEVAVATTPPAPVQDCVPAASAYATVVSARTVAVQEPAVLVTDDAILARVGGYTPVSADRANAVEYTLRTREGQTVTLVSNQRLARGDMVFIEADSCDRAQLTVIAESG